jgi:uncharacterized repeat protein (TIGR03803 family)
MPRMSLRTAAALSACLLAGAIAARAQTFTLLHSFDMTDGAYPLTLIQATDGNLYGTTSYGGTKVCPLRGPNVGCGTVFKITPGGTLTTLYNFCSKTDCDDGYYPFAGLVQATDGNFYGTTYFDQNEGPGTIFRITPEGKLTTLHRFDGGDGANPSAPLIQASDGNLYGTTYEGGAAEGGTAFKITLDGTFTLLHTFCTGDCSDGGSPVAGLIQGTDGNLYGTTSSGGEFFGTVFEMTTDGTVTTLHSFGFSDGANPAAGLVQASNGNFYGTTSSGGANFYYGTAFGMTPDGAFTTLYNFGAPGGTFPMGPLIQATDGNLYGTTSEGGPSDSGSLFRLTTGGVLTTLHDFDFTDGAYPVAALLEDTNGVLYGTAAEGANADTNAGTVFSLSVGLGPFVVTQPAAGKVGQTVTILGTNLTGATSVTFNGTAAAFTVTSGSDIKAEVPTGATTGPVQVTKPAGTVTSNVNFQVLP